MGCVDKPQQLTPQHWIKNLSPISDFKHCAQTPLNEISPQESIMTFSNQKMAAKFGLGLTPDNPQTLI